jgi:hypothetical protein
MHEMQSDELLNVGLDKQRLVYHQCNRGLEHACAKYTDSPVEARDYIIGGFAKMFRYMFVFRFRILASPEDDFWTSHVHDEQRSVGVCHSKKACAAMMIYTLRNRREITHRCQIEHT